jgi:urease accessory protein
MNLALLQLVDSAFPAGGFAHSGGLEAMAHAGLVRSAGELATFARSSAWQCALGALPFAIAAHADPGTHAAIDRRMDETMWSHVARRASTVQGRALADAAARSFDLPELHALKARIAEKTAAGHLAPVFGVVARALDARADDLSTVLVFTSVRGVVSAAVRLGLVGPYEAQRLLASMHSLVARAAAEGRERSIDAVAQPAVTIELLQATHDGLYSRLFQS